MGSPSPSAASPMLCYTQARYADASEQETGLNGWSQRYCQLSRGAFAGSIETLAMEGICIHRERINVATEQHVVTPPDHLVFATTLGPSDDWRVNAAPLPGRAVTISDAGQEILAVSSPGSDLLLISVRRELLDASGYGRFAAGQSLVTENSPTSELTGWVLGLLNHCRTQQAHDVGALEALIPALLTERLTEIAASARGAAAPMSLHEAARLVRRSCEVVLDQSLDALTAADLAAALGIPMSQLTAAFKVGVGLSPAQWMRQQRLGGARRALTRARPGEATVSEIAMAWGFWHLGRFADYYQRQFGERPSDTLQRSGATSARDADRLWMVH
mgnify:CR=1 FL=1